jgi:hypothetical protein
MATFAYASARGRTAASNYALLEVLGGGGAALVQWRLETGRTHQVGGRRSWARTDVCCAAAGRIPSNACAQLL